MSEDGSASDTSPSSDSGAADSCESCDSLIDLTTWTPTVADDSGEILRFCDESCRESWRED